MFEAVVECCEAAMEMIGAMHSVRSNFGSRSLAGRRLSYRYSRFSIPIVAHLTVWTNVFVFDLCITGSKSLVALRVESRIPIVLCCFSRAVRKRDTDPHLDSLERLHIDTAIRLVLHVDK